MPPGTAPGGHLRILQHLPNSSTNGQVSSANNVECGLFLSHIRCAVSAKPSAYRMSACAFEVDSLRVEFAQQSQFFISGRFGRSYLPGGLQSPARVGFCIVVGFAGMKGSEDQFAVRIRFEDADIGDDGLRAAASHPRLFARRAAAEEPGSGNEITSLGEPSLLVRRDEVGAIGPRGALG